MAHPTLPGVPTLLRGAGGGPNPIQAVEALGIPELSNGDTIAVTPAGWDQTSNYTSSEGAIVSAVGGVTLNGDAAAVGDPVAYDDLVAVSVLVTDAEDNARLFSTSRRVPFVAPSIDGVPTLSTLDPVVGEPITVTPAEVTGDDPIDTQFRLIRDGVPGALGSSTTYTPVEADIGQRLGVRQVSTNAAGTATADSAETEPVAEAPSGPEDVQATGGIETVINPAPGEFYRLHTFLEGGSLEVLQGGSIRAVVIAHAGDGGDARFQGAGGGSGGDVLDEFVTVDPGIHLVAVGAKGQDTSALGLVARFGGKGENGISNNYSGGGQGGGGAGLLDGETEGSRPGFPHPTSFSGGTGGHTDADLEWPALQARLGGGGRGAGGDGQSRVGMTDLTSGGDGGPGVFSDITGNLVEYGRGGGGGNRAAGLRAWMTAGEPSGHGVNYGDAGAGASSGENTIFPGFEGAPAAVMFRYPITEAEYLAEVA